ncbi:MAG: 2-oxoglutarate and iron-dependent oxygenase domain-containing protein [Bdellovibrionales bacterium]
MATTKKYTNVPELSLKTYINGSDEERADLCKQLWDGFKYFGFIILKDHPISTDLLDKSYAMSKTFFDLPEEVKRKYTGVGGGQRGYTPFGTENAKGNAHPDLKEFWHIGRDLEPDNENYSRIPKNLWPEEVQEFQKTFQSLFKALDDTGKVMLEALTPSLDVAKDYFTKMTQDGDTKLRLLHYPPIPENADPNCVRAAAHEDINLITVLVAATQTGLELLDRDGKWLPVETDANNLIVDAGDMLARITNDIIPATTHRVVNPAGENVSRYSMPFFIHPHPDAVLKCIPSCIGEGAKYPEITAHDCLMQRLREIGLM